MAFNRSISGFLSLLFILLSASLAVFGAVQPSEVAAQGGTFTPDPDCCFTIVPTWGAIQTNTPAVHTVTPVGTPDRTGCVETGFDQEGLDPNWVAQCMRCLELRSTPQATIQSVVLLTVPPLATGMSNPNPPTLPPMYEPAGAVPPTATATPPPPTPTGEADDWHLIYYDFELYHYDVEFGTYVCSGLNTGVYVPGQGFKPTYSDCQSVWALQIHWTRDDLMPSNARNFSLHGSINGSPEYFSLSGTAGGATTPSDYDSSILQIRTWFPERDYRGWWWTDVTEGVKIKGMSFEYYGQEGEWGEEEEPTPTPEPTATTPAVVISCDEPLYVDISTPIVDIDNLDAADMGEDCYTIIPEINITITDPDISYDGLELCVRWRRLPTLSILGIELSIDLLLILPAAYVLRRMYTM